ncbi:hypothetical protein SLS59_004433 [Nothophoma quercina]|uniref:NAD-dependent epimerase/dehydratase domain-containing protein n=1 Tax=Nothophoma quercina TaxID=749835 RepID=A0ABR3RG48_9PLEO
MTKSVFITGGSGYIGSTLITHAIAAGYTITALSRTPTSDVKLSSLGAAPVRGDITNLSVLAQEASRADIVISIADSLAGNFHISKAERFEINDTANDALATGLASGATSGVADGSRKERGTDRCLILTGGTLFSAPNPAGGETDESSPGWPAGHWADFELGAISQSWVNAGIRVCTVRLAPYVYGRGGSGVGLFMGMWRKQGEGMVIDGGKRVSTSVHVDDAVRLYLAVAERGRAGEICEFPFHAELTGGIKLIFKTDNAAAENDFTQAQLAQAICKAIGVPCKSFTYEEAVPKVGEFLANFLSVENRASNRKAREELGWKVKERGILQDIESGSYVEVAQALKEGSAG